ncbi:MAG: site-2 protease family protein [Ruminococcaceae bacterium]|nr:site-2 protease family protein [Oscillospiraceae bacterium]
MLGGGDLPSYLISILLSLPIVLLALSVHEAAHGFAAWRLGDPTARNFGRLTLNPLKHLDPYGFICMLLVGFGWANPVPVNSRFFKKPRRDIALVGLAGPLSNLLLAVVFLLLLRFVGFGWLAQLPISSQLQFNLIYFTCLLLYYGVYMNVTLAIFNLLPVPPLDGSRIFYVFLPPRLYYKIMQHQRTITIVVMALLLLGPLSALINFISDLIIGGLFALTGMSGFLI